MIRPVLAFIAVALLGACSQSPGTSPAASASAPHALPPLDGRFLFGGSPYVVWEFHADSGTVTFRKDPPGTFTTDPYYVTITFYNGEKMQLRRRDADYLESGSGGGLVRESAALAARKPTAPAPLWDAARAQAAAVGDSGVKEPYECTANVVMTTEQHMLGQRPSVATDLPAAGIVKKSDTQMLVTASNATAALAVLKAAWVGGGVFTPHCERSLSSVKAAASTVPFDRYEAITSSMQVRGQYYAHASGPIDYEKEISGDNAYMQEHDGFKKRDILVKFSTQVDAAVDHARTHPYIRLPDVSTLLPAYDFKRGLTICRRSCRPTSGSASSTSRTRLSGFDWPTRAAFKPTNPPARPTPERSKRWLRKLPAAWSE